MQGFRVQGQASGSMRQHRVHGIDVIPLPARLGGCQAGIPALLDVCDALTPGAWGRRSCLRPAEGGCGVCRAAPGSWPRVQRTGLMPVCTSLADGLHDQHVRHSQMPKITHLKRYSLDQQRAASGRSKPGPHADPGLAISNVHRPSHCRPAVLCRHLPTHLPMKWYAPGSATAGDAEAVSW